MKRTGIRSLGFVLVILSGFAPVVHAEPAKLPCDIYADDGGPCVAAHSTVRRLSSTYTGPLYQIRREGPSGGTTKDISPLADGFADATAQDTFCGTRRCTISIIYDQSGKGNHLTKAPPAENRNAPGKEANAKGSPITISGHNLYGEHNTPGVAYRNNQAVGTAKADNPETIYMVASGTYHNNWCCFEYGNVQTNNHFNGEGTQETIYFGRYDIMNKGAGSGPWIMADLAEGMWAGTGSPFQNDPSITHKYVTGIVKAGLRGSKRLVVKVGNAQSDGLLTVFDGSRVSRWEIMRKEGGIALGSDGRGAAGGVGDFFEGVMTAHCSSDRADDDVHANIVSVYGKY